MRGTLIGISGKTNSGKTTLAISMAKNALLNGWLVSGNDSFKAGFSYPTLADCPLDDDHDFDVGLKLAIFDDADRMGETLNPLVERLREQGTHVVTITHGPSDKPVVSITGQLDVFLMRALFGSTFGGSKRHDAGGDPLDGWRPVGMPVHECGALRVDATGDPIDIQCASPEEMESILANLCCLHLNMGGDDAASVLYDVARKVGVRVVIAKSDCSGLDRASADEADLIISNTRVRFHMDLGGDDVPQAGDSVSAADAKPNDERVTSSFHHGGAIGVLAMRLKAAGYIPGQTYEQCCNMALWHPGMAKVMEDIDNKVLFGVVMGVIAQNDLKHHEIVWGKTRDGMLTR